MAKKPRPLSTSWQWVLPALLLSVVLSTNFYAVHFLAASSGGGYYDAERERLRQNDEAVFARKKRAVMEERARDGWLGYPPPSDETRPKSRPDGWERMGFHEVRSHFDCDSRRAALERREMVASTPLPSLKDWRTFQDKFRAVAGDGSIKKLAAFKDQTLAGDDGYMYSYALYTDGEVEGGPEPPYYAAHYWFGRGRGLFANRDISRGELLHDGTKSDVRFPNAAAWREYVFSLPTVAMACDAIDWTWTRPSGERGEHHIYTAINISVMFKNGDILKREDITPRHINVTPRERYSTQLFATRHIQKNEEIITDYHFYPMEWGAVGL